jgi:hypothetical protein
MTPADWRALIEAFLEGRLSADAFERRFLEAWRAQLDRGARNPPAIDRLFHVVAGYSAARDGRTPSGADESQLRNEAAAALNELRLETPTRTYDRARAREEIRRFRVRISQLAGIGCALALAWVAVGVLQIYFVSEQIQHALHWGAWPSSIVGFFLAFVPIVGNVLAFFGAINVGGWPVWIAALVFFAAPAATLVSGFLRWRRWRRLR